MTYTRQHRWIMCASLSVLITIWWKSGCVIWNSLEWLTKIIWRYILREQICLLRRNNFQKSFTFPLSSALVMIQALRLGESSLKPCLSSLISLRSCFNFSVSSLRLWTSSCRLSLSRSNIRQRVSDVSDCDQWMDSYLNPHSLLCYLGEKKLFVSGNMVLKSVEGR